MSTAYRFPSVLKSDAHEAEMDSRAATAGLETLCTCAHTLGLHDLGADCMVRGCGCVRFVAIVTPVQILGSFAWTEYEKWVVRWQFGYLDSFQLALANLMARADDENLARLSVAFPIEAKGMRLWRTTDLGDRLRAAGLPI